VSLPESVFPQGETPFFIPGPLGQIESLVYSAGDSHKVAIICHPNPLFHGTMNNKVVYTLSRAFHAMGITAVRFNYRGVGKSDGSYGNSVGETEDLLAVIAWVKSKLPDAEFYLAGFSFGSYIAASGATCIQCSKLFSIAPAVTHQSYSALPRIQCPWIVVQGGQDEIVPPEAVYEWFEQAKTHHQDLRLIKIPEASHFFHGKLVTLREIVEQNLVTYSSPDKSFGSG
jgi:uncharacterized protein